MTRPRELLRGVSNEAVSEAKMRFKAKRKGETLGVAQIRDIRRALPTERDVLIFDVCIFCGLRASEAARLKRIHLRQDGWIDVPGTKTELSDDVVPCSPDLMAQLQARSTDVFEGECILFDQKLHRTWLEETLQPAAKRVGVEKCNMLTLRRTAVTMMATKDPSAAARLARHSSTEMVHKVYNNADLLRVQELQRLVIEETIQ